MEQIWLWGISVIEVIQKITCKPLDYVAYFFHYIFNTPIYGFLLMLFCWCISYRKAIQIGSVVLASSAVNSGVKAMIKAPRPYQFSSANFNATTYAPGKGIVDYSDSPVFRIEESGYSTPSGHSQVASSFWPLFASCTKWKKVWKVLLAVFLPCFVAVTRLYLGVHYPTDVMLGLIIGFLFSGAFLLWGAKIESGFQKLRKIVQVLILAVIVVILNFVTPGDTSMPGALFGMVLGSILMDGGKKFDASKGVWWQKLVRFILGLTMAAVVYVGLKKLFPGKDAPLGQLFRFLRYGLVAFTITFIAPIVFVKIHLGQKEDENLPLSKMRYVDYLKIRDQVIAGKNQEKNK